MTALISYVTSVATAAKTESDAQADAAEARVIASVGDALTATAEEATVATTAAKAMAGAEAIAEIAFALASQAWVQVTAAADLTFANSSIDASLTASNDAVDAVHAYVVASIGVNLIASTAATGFALLREHSAINAMTTAQKAAINAACTATLANLASDLTGRNASEALDDPIAIAAATNNAAQAVKAAWQNVNNLQSRAASTFAGMGPGGFAMTFAGFTTGVGDFFDGFGSGYWHYLTNPSEMSTGLQYGFYGLLGAGGALLGVAGGLAAGAAIGVTAIGTVPLSQLPAQLFLEWQFLTAATTTGTVAANRASAFGPQSVGAAQTPFQAIVETEVAMAMNGRWPTSEAWEIMRLSAARSVVNLDPNLGTSQVRYQAQFFDHVMNVYVNISFNYDPITGLFGIIKQASR
jgi:hypothetical protein